MAYEAGLKPWELRRVTLRDFNAFYVGYRRRQEEQWDIARRTWQYMIQFGGMGLKAGAKVPDIQDLYPLQYRDRSVLNDASAGISPEPITSIDQALKLLEEFNTHGKV